MGGEIPAMFVPKLIEMRMGMHIKTLSFNMAPGIKRPLVLGLFWHLKRNPNVNRRNGLLKIQWATCEKRGDKDC